MPLILNCTACDTPLTVARRHRGGRAPCPTCGTAVDVPRQLGFADLAREAAADRRRGAWLLTAAWASGFVWLPVAPAAALWLTTRQIRLANDAGRPVVGQLHAARTIAATALFAQCTYFAAALAGWWTFIPLRFFFG